MHIHNYVVLKTNINLYRKKLILITGNVIINLILIIYRDIRYVIINYFYLYIVITPIKNR